MDYPLVLVEWIDAAFQQEITWASENMKPYHIHTVGWLTKTAPDHLVVAMELIDDPQDHSVGLKYRHVYPREMVRKVTLLETGAQWEWPQEA